MTKYKQFKDKICLPLIYAKMFLVYILATATQANPKWKGDRHYVRFSAGKVNTIFLLLAPTVVFVLFMIGFLIQMAGIYRFLWVWPMIYFAYAFDYIWLNEDEELLFSKSIEKITMEEQEEDDTNAEDE